MNTNTPTTTLLTHAFMARDVLREALNIPAAVIYSDIALYSGLEIAEDQPVICVVAPLRAVGERGYENITLKITTPAPTTCYAIFGNHGRTFRLSRNNLLGFLGLDHIPIKWRGVKAASQQQWIARQIQARTDFKWERADNKNITTTAMLHPKSTLPVEELIDQISYPRYRVYSKQASQPNNPTPWTYGLFQPTGELGRGGPSFRTELTAQDAAELEAVKQGHMPVLPQAKPSVLMWTSNFKPPVASEASKAIYIAHLSSGQAVLITEESQHSVWFRGPDKTVTELVSGLSRDEALHAALTTISELPAP